MLKIKCKQCNEVSSVRSEYIINNKTVCPECKVIITILGDIVGVDQFIDLPTEERRQLKKVMDFRTNRASQFESMEKFEEEINSYKRSLFQSFPSIDFVSIGRKITRYLIQNNKELNEDEILTFKKMIAIMAALVEVQQCVEEVGESFESEITNMIEKIQAK